MEREVIVVPSLHKQPDILSIANELTGGNINGKIENLEKFKKLLLEKVVLDWARKNLSPGDDATYSGYVFSSKKSIFHNKKRKTKFFTNYVIPEIMTMFPSSLLYVDVNYRNGKKIRLVSDNKTMEILTGIDNILEILKKGRTISDISLAIKYLHGIMDINIQRYFMLKSRNGEFVISGKSTE